MINKSDRLQRDKVTLQGGERKGEVEQGEKEVEEEIQRQRVKGGERYTVTVQKVKEDMKRRNGKKGRFCSCYKMKQSQLESRWEIST